MFAHDTKDNGTQSAGSEELKISFIIATFNSMPLLKTVLDAIRKQDVPATDYEIIVVDGGSKDDTMAVARAEGCRVITNPKTEPVYAKFLGFHAAKGRYVCYLDHDEVFTRSDSLSRRLATLERHPDVRILLGTGYKSPDKLSIVNNYINEFGDPFSCFIYGLSKDYRFFPRTMKRRYKAHSTAQHATIFSYDRKMLSEIIEIVAAGSVFEKAYALKMVPEIETQPSVLPHLFYKLFAEDIKLAIMEDDALLHYSSMSWSAYVKKIRWRVINNVFNHNSLGEAGFSGRQKAQSQSQALVKYMFMPYAFSLLLPFAHACYLAFSRRNFRYLSHVPLTIYTASEILWQYSKKVLGLVSPLRSYDGTVRIER